MYGLIFDVCGAACGIALLKGGVIKHKFLQKADFGQADFLLPEIKNMLDKENISMEDLSFVSATTGPGSFAGLRAGIAIVKGFSIACPELKVIGINCFELYLSELKNLSECNLVVIETKRDDFYFQVFNSKKEPVSQPMSAPKEDILALVKGKKISIIGDGVERFLNTSTGMAFENIVISDGISIEALSELAYKKYLDKSFNFVHPLYIKDGVARHEVC